jgi:hypothetical protein
MAHSKDTFSGQFGKPEAKLRKEGECALRAYEEPR